MTQHIETTTAGYSPDTTPTRRPGKGGRLVAAALLGTTLAAGFAVQGALKPEPGRAVASAEALPAMTERYKMNQIVRGLADEIGELYMQAEASGGSKMAGTSQNAAGKTTSYIYGYSGTAPVEASTAAEISMTKGEGDYDLSVSYMPITVGGVASTTIVGVDILTGVRGRPTVDYSQTYSLHISRDPTDQSQWSFSAWSGNRQSTVNPGWYANFSLDPEEARLAPNTVQSADDLTPYVEQARQIIQNAPHGDAVGYLPDPTR